MPNFQSAYRANHSTETAVLWVLSDIRGAHALDRGDFAILTLLKTSRSGEKRNFATLHACSALLKVITIGISFRSFAT